MMEFTRIFSSIPLFKSLARVCAFSLGAFESKFAEDGAYQTCGSVGPLSRVVDQASECVVTLPTYYRVCLEFERIRVKGHPH